MRPVSSRGKIGRMERERRELAILHKLAARADLRAAHARQHAADARDVARSDAARGDHYAEKIHLSEAEAHEGAARVTEQTAALYRNRVRRLQTSVTDALPAS